MKYKRFFLTFYLATISLIIIFTTLQANAANICMRGSLPTEIEYTKAQNALKELNNKFNHLMNIGTHRPGDAQFTPHIVKEAEKRKAELQEKHIANLRKIQLPKYLNSCIESTYSYEKLRDLFVKYYTMASLYLENQDYSFNEKLALQLMIIKTLGPYQ